MDRFDSIVELQPQRGSAVPAQGSESGTSPLHSTGLSATEQAKDGERPARPSDVAFLSTTNDGPHLYTLVEPASPTQASPTHATGLPLSAGRRTSSPFASAASPGSAFRSPSPRHLSPATSQIFERDVQESSAMGPELSPAIPNHIQTEDHIPPVLEASSLAITDNQLNPDQVEIVMHSEHRPAAVAVSGGNALSDGQPLIHGSHYELGVPGQDHEEASSSYGAVDPADPRRLSFISFADVVHAEHVETGKESSHLQSPASLVPSGGARSPSPIRSPLSDRALGSPPTSGSTSFNATDLSPVRGGHGSAISAQGHPHGELMIETMRQTLQKTGSNEPGLQPSTPV